MIKFFNRRPPTHQEQLEQYRAQSHKNFAAIKMGDSLVPVIEVDVERFTNVMSLYKDANPAIDSIRKHGVIYSEVDVISDGLGNVFGKLIMTFPNKKTEQFLIDATKNMDFFVQMTTSLMYAVGPIDGPGGIENILVVQLPKRDDAEGLLFKIQKDLQRK